MTVQPVEWMSAVEVNWPKVPHLYCECQWELADSQVALCRWVHRGKLHNSPSDVQECVVCSGLFADNVRCPVCGAKVLMME